MMQFGRILISGGGVLAGMLWLLTPAVSLADGWGSVEGRFVLEDGDIPELEPLVMQGDTSAKDADVCAANGVPDETLVINPENRGIANICLYIRSAPDEIHPDLVDSEEPEVVFDQKDCRFVPHVLIVRTDQKVLLKSDDPISHNTHTHPFSNSEFNFIIQPRNREGVPVEMEVSELRTPPVKVTCDIHSWMTAYWMVSDHPYVAVTDSDGRFRVENLPEGSHTFRVWHERAGYLETEAFQRDLEVTIEDGQVTELEPITVSPDVFFKD